MIASEVLPRTLTEQILDAATRSALSAGAEARVMAQRCLTDWFGCAIAGASDPLVEKLLAAARELSSEGRSPLVGRSERLSLSDAALVNGAAGHALDYDDTLLAMVGHPSAPIAPALLGLAARVNASGADLVTAYILAIDVATRVGILLAPDHYERGFHGTGTGGAIGAAAGCSYLLGLDAAACAVAIGLAGTRAAGLKASFGSEAKSLHAGWAALVGLTAAFWAKQGFVGASDIAGDKVGLRALSETFNPEAATADHPPHILDVKFKFHAACHGTHATIEALGEILREHRITADDVEAVRVQADPKVDTVCNRQVVNSGLEAKFSLRMVSAFVLAGVDTAAIDSYGTEVISRGDVRRAFDRVTVELVEGLEAGETKVIVVAKDGRSFQATGVAQHLRGDAAQRALEAKFRALVIPVLGDTAAERLLGGIQSLESCDDVASLMEATVLRHPEPLGLR
jgi:2-methylcitrate dehydratase PrpD